MVGRRMWCGFYRVASQDVHALRPRARASRMWRWEVLLKDCFRLWEYYEQGQGKFIFIWLRRAVPPRFMEKQV